MENTRPASPRAIVAARREEEIVVKYKEWEIRGAGGFCTLRHFWASRGAEAFWAWRQQDVKALIDLLEDGKLSLVSISDMHRPSFS